MNGEVRTGTVTATTRTVEAEAAARGVKLTPMMRQYLAVKVEHPRALLFFRMGDFYELFFEDAETAARELELTLTSRSKGADAVPMAGVPHHAVQGYLRRLIEKGYSVAICDQIEDPRAAQGIVRRAVSRVVTPGLVIDPEALDERGFHYLVAVACGAETIGLAALDLTTGEFCAGELRTAAELIDEFARLRPREVLVAEPETARVRGWLEQAGLDVCVTGRDAGDFAAAPGAQRLREHFAASPPALEVIGALGTAAGAAGAVTIYVAETQKSVAAHVDRIAPLPRGEFLLLDEATQRNLELTRTLADGRRKGSLLGVLDRAATAMGARRLTQWILRPLARREAIVARQAAVSFFVEYPDLLDRVREQLSGMADLERLNARVAMNVATPRDLVALRDALGRTAPLAALFEGREPSRWLAERLPALAVPADLIAELSNALADAAPLAVNEGGIFRRGYSAALDELIDLAEHGEDRMLALETRERERSGIANLKVRYNKVFGYYIEVTKANVKSVPADFIRKQTIVNGERYYTPELKDLEEKVLAARDNRLGLEADMFAALRDRVAAHTVALRACAETLADLDAAADLAFVAVKQRYCRPEITDAGVTDVREGRHPVIETMALGEPFVPNDVDVGGAGRRLMLITGPNMAGKSTAMRQVALITLLAQMGAWVPARAATIGVCDRIFTRVGASDFIARGQSTFMVEMIETANILHHATRDSLVILDEIGRGTSTFDGLSIAWAVAEYLHDRVGCRTLFATHYHELTELIDALADGVNCRIEVKEWHGQVIFLRKLVDGGAHRSYGIEVAKLAGLPAGVLERAREVLAQLEADGAATSSQLEARRGGRQLSLFVPYHHGASATEKLVLQRLRAAEVENLTPVAALNLLAEVAALLRGAAPEPDPAVAAPADADDHSSSPN